MNEIAAEVDTLNNLKTPINKLGQNDLIEQKFMRLSPNEGQFKPLATQRLTFSQRLHNASVQIPSRKLPQSPENQLAST